MKKRLLFLLLIVVVILATSCSLLEDVKTEFVIKNHDNSTEDIIYVTIQQYIGLGERSILNNALPEDTTIIPGEKVFFEIAPYMAEGAELLVTVTFANSTTGRVSITYVPEVKFKLVCNNNPGSGEAMFILRTEEDYESEITLNQIY
jgi:hypothetical protein